MSSRINFLRQHQSAMSVQTRKDRRIARYTAYALAAFLVVVIGIVIARVGFELQRRSISTNLDAARKGISGYSKIEQDYIVFARKVQIMHALDEQRETKRAAVQFFYNLIPSEDVIQHVELDAKQSQIAFQVQAPDVFRMLDLLRIMREKISADKNYLLQLETVARRQDATYILTGSLAYSGEALNAAKGAK